jgi:hypothetical protein
LPSVAIFDENLSEPGVEPLVAIIRKRDPARHCQLVLLHSLSKDFKAARGRGFNGDIAKPVKRSALRRLLIELGGNVDETPTVAKAGSDPGPSATSTSRRLAT